MHSTETVGVTEVVIAILRARQTMPSATSATVSRQQHGESFHIRVTLTNDDGFAEVVAEYFGVQLGKDLADAFGEDDFLTLK
jgi:hypothetical protein